MNLVKLVLFMIFTVAVVDRCRAAVVTFARSKAITGDSDVNSSGSLIAAFNFGGSNVPSTTINGVTFSPFALAGNPTTVGDYQISETAVVAGLHAANDFGSDSPPFSSLSTSYQSLLSTAVYGGSPETLELELNDLTIGQSYLLQLWSNLSNNVSVFPAGTQTASGGGGDLVVMSQNLALADGGTGHYTLGRFVADSVTQLIRINGGSALPILNGFQLRTFSGSLPGDFDNDSDVDGRDFLDWQRGNSPAPISATDLADWRLNYGLEFENAPFMLAVPEPNSFYLVGIAMLGLFPCHRFS